MKVRIGEHVFRLPWFRVGYLGYFSVRDMMKIALVEPLEAIRDWIPEDYAMNLARDIIAPDSREGSVYLARSLDAHMPDEDCTIIDEDLFFKTAFVCSEHFCLLDNPALNTESLGRAVGRNLTIVNKILGEAS